MSMRESAIFGKILEIVNQYRFKEKAYIPQLDNLFPMTLTRII